jgi:hypothetical protein
LLILLDKPANNQKIRKELNHSKKMLAFFGYFLTGNSKGDPAVQILLKKLKYKLYIDPTGQKKQKEIIELYISITLVKRDLLSGLSLWA